MHTHYVHISGSPADREAAVQERRRERQPRPRSDARFAQLQAQSSRIRESQVRMPTPFKLERATALDAQAAVQESFRRFRHSC